MVDGQYHYFGCSHGIGRIERDGVGSFCVQWHTFPRLEAEFLSKLILGGVGDRMIFIRYFWRSNHRRVLG
jgi:hypothetical protein